MKLALGTAQFGLKYGIANATDQTDRADIHRILERGSHSGMDTLDTAVLYGDSESILGALGVENWRVVSKLPAVPLDCISVEKWVIGQLLQSRKRLGVVQLYGVLLHRPMQLLGGTGREIYAALNQAKDLGLVKKVGLSVYSPSELNSLFNRYPVDLIQAPFNIFDRRLVDSGWGKVLKSRGVEVHTRSTFLQGLLLMSAGSRPPKFNRWKALWSEFDHWLDREGLTRLQACLGYALSSSLIDRVIVGVDTLEHLDQILEVGEEMVPNVPEFKDLLEDDLLDPSRWNLL